MLNMIAPFEMGICVDNLDTMIAFYRDILGFELISEIDVLADRSTKAGFTVGGYRIVRMQTHYGERIKLVQPAHTPPRVLPKRCPCDGDRVIVN